MDKSVLQKEEITQDELFEAIQNGLIAQQNVVFVGITLKDIDTNLFAQMRYNPFEMQQMPKETIFIFYCDTGKETLENLKHYKAKLPSYRCYSLRGGRGYWRPNKPL
jgi:hypothetical protein